MPQYLELPNGSYLELKEGQTAQEGMAVARQLYPEAFGIKKEPEAKPESGFIAATKAGISGLQSAGAALAGRTGLMDAERAARIMEEEKKYQERTFKPTEIGRAHV